MSEKRDLTEILIGRVDGLEVTVAKHGRDLDAVNAGLKVLLKNAEESDGQPDWIGITDPAAAGVLLSATVRWLDRHGTYLGIELPPCWPWHPKVVVVMVALAEHYKTVYAGASASAVTDYLGRTIQGFDKLIRTVRDTCNEHEHIIGSAQWTPDRRELPELAAWWATSDRQGVPPGLHARHRRSA